jgi:hypothetical protein
MVMTATPSGLDDQRRSARIDHLRAILEADVADWFTADGHLQQVCELTDLQAAIGRVTRSVRETADGGTESVERLVIDKDAAISELAELVLEFR